MGKRAKFISWKKLIPLFHLLHGIGNWFIEELRRDQNAKSKGLIAKVQTLPLFSILLFHSLFLLFSGNRTSFLFYSSIPLLPNSPGIGIFWITKHCNFDSSWQFQGLWPDAGTKVGDIDGKLCKWWWVLPLLILCCAWLWPHCSCGHLCAGLPPNCWGTALWCTPAPEEDQPPQRFPPLVAKVK